MPLVTLDFETMYGVNLAAPCLILAKNIFVN